MLRFLRLRKIPTFSSQMLSYSLKSNILTRTCSFCNHQYTLKYQNDLPNFGTSVPVRHSSTSTHTAVSSVLIKKKKRRRIRKKYAELLEVTGSSMNQRKASVSKLKPIHLSLLAEQPDISLSQLHNLKKLKKKLIAPEPSSEFADSEAVLHASEILELPLEEELKKEFVEELETSLGEHFDNDVDEHHEFEMPDKKMKTVKNKDKTIIAKSSSTEETVRKSFSLSQKEKMAKVKFLELNRAGKEESLSRSLCAYLDLCVSCGLLNRGLTTLLFYHNRSKSNDKMPAVKDIRLFNILLHGFASKGDVTQIKEILQILLEDDIRLTAQSFAACLECVGRLPQNEDSDEFLKSCCTLMRNHLCSFNDVMQNSIFVADQRETVLNAIRRLEPEYVPVIPPPDTCYSCSLLQDLNKTNDEEGKYFKSPAQNLLNISELRELSKQQMKLEINNYVLVNTIEKRLETTKNIQYYRQKLEEAQKEWKETITKAFERDLEVLRVKSESFNGHHRMNLYPFLKVLEPHQYTDLILQEIRSLAEGSETFSPFVKQLHRDLGILLKNRYEVKYKIDTGIMKKTETLYDYYCQWYLNPDKVGIRNSREYWQHLLPINREGPDVSVNEKLWPATVLYGVGKFLYNIILKDIKIDVNIKNINSKTRHLMPAFYTVFRNQRQCIKEEIKPHPMLVRLFRGAAQEKLVYRAIDVPMLCPPLPWSSVNCGGYLLAKTDLIRLSTPSMQQRLRLDETPVQQLYPVLDSLNQLAAIPWMINKPVLDIVIEIFNDGGSQKLDIPEPPSACPPPDVITSGMTKFEKFQVRRQRANLRQRKADMYSLWCDALYRLSLANHFRDRIFWLPHNIDFRGRVYPRPPHLNHLGSDMARALLYFAKGKPLGPRGFDWLKIHLVNLTGLKKRDPLSERLRYAEEIMPEIIDSAENPLTGKMWWAQSEEPWQTLACCLEIAKVLNSDNPEEYVCHFPVHQDGSCNGLQHYAALGRDKAGAASVNLTSAPLPQDVYSCVAALVERERIKDAAEGLITAQILDGFIQRKVIKQTVMTTVYGVTRFGARLQIARQLKDIENFPKEFVWKASFYLVAKTFESIREMFTSTKEIQDWFTECARLISQVCGQNVEWVTPLGLPVVQPYYRPHKKYITDSYSKKLKEHFLMDAFQRPNVLKQKNAFPPNFIHCLDSCHMMLTSLLCERNGATFVSVHDCFWTHPSTVELMNKICRDQFVALHSEPILEDLSVYLTKKFGYSDSDIIGDGSSIDMAKCRLNRILASVPSTGDFCLKDVLDSVYFFS